MVNISCLPNILPSLGFIGQRKKDSMGFFVFCFFFVALKKKKKKGYVDRKGIGPILNLLKGKKFNVVLLLLPSAVVPFSL